MAVTLEMIATRLGVATPDSTSTQGKQWAEWIGDAQALIDMRAVQLGLDPTTLDPATVDRVVALAVVAMVRNPDDVTTVDVSVDDGRVLKSRKSSDGQVSITDLWWGWLGLAGHSGAFSTRPGFDPDRGPLDPWVPLP